MPEISLKNKLLYGLSLGLAISTIVIGLVAICCLAIGLVVLFPTPSSALAYLLIVGMTGAPILSLLLGSYILENWIPKLNTYLRKTFLGMNRASPISTSTVLDMNQEYSQSTPPKLNNQEGENNSSKPLDRQTEHFPPLFSKASTNRTEIKGEYLLPILTM
ncbi:hypothetical protein [Rickettsiella endosymbiont of Miltochrista miniata]|uniref:hypothetical protein n=1 Tax=Rickettsiella endosymbiont of Miltochrista miniata TaxID=3066239 RepID=UPI00313DF47B